jgi:hypothetical protein
MASTPGQPTQMWDPASPSTPNRYFNCRGSEIRKLKVRTHSCAFHGFVRMKVNSAGEHQCTTHMQPCEYFTSQTPPSTARSPIVQSVY